MKLLLMSNIIYSRKFPEIVVLDYCAAYNPSLGVFDMHDAFFFTLMMNHIGKYFILTI